MTKQKQELRWGYSTGACAAAIAAASWLCHEKNPSQAPSISELLLHFLDGQSQLVPLLPKGTVEDYIAIQKDGGDDPDCTHKAIIYGSLEPVSTTELEQVATQDYVIHFDADGHIITSQTTDFLSISSYTTVIIQAIEGIGLCTRIGLDCDQGKWAINTGPRAMIALNLAKAGLHAGSHCGPWLLRLGVQDGEKISRHTLNKQLGIMGGISILGTTGHVRPYSHDAYIATVRICVQSNAMTGGRHMVFCTGGRTMRGARALYPYLPETAFVCMGDFIAESLVAADKHGMHEVTVACMAGKLCKYAAGFEYTHAHTVAQDMDLLRKVIAEQVSAIELSTQGRNGHEQNSQVLNFSDDFHTAPTVREALLHLPNHLRLTVLKGLAQQALKIFAERCHASCLRLAVFDFDGSFLFSSEQQGNEVIPQ
ncbi:MAG: cobalt-precorrin-5B (C(1))-methyltransferase CbiD [Pseudomonadota bacterium]